MSSYQSNLESKLFASADDLRGKMDAAEYKNYILGFMFYKYLSEKLEFYLNKQLEKDGLSFAEAYKQEKYQLKIEKLSIERLGYFIRPENLFSTIMKKSVKGTIVDGEKSDGFILDDLALSLSEISNSSIGKDSQDEFSNLFDDVNLDSTKLGSSPEKINNTIVSVLTKLDAIDFNVEEDDSDVLGDAYEFLLSQFASEAGKKAGEFYTPSEVSTVVAKIACNGRPNIDSVYDPTCGSGSLLLKVLKETEVRMIYGQELNTTTFNLARMNMILHGVKYKKFDIQQEDSLEEPKHMGMKFDAIVANPPFSADWNPRDSFLDDPRFSAYGKLAPKTKADFAFVQHMIYHLADDGVMAVVLPHGVLFRGYSEKTIREYLVGTKNYLDAVIGLPANLFYGTGIPTCILVFKKCRKVDSKLLFIDASKGFEKDGKKNKLREEDIDKIVNTYMNREEIEKYSSKVSIEEIKENDFNLNIPRYVDSFEEEEDIDLEEVSKKIKEITKEMKEVDKDIKKYCEELGIDAPIF